MVLTWCLPVSGDFGGVLRRPYLFYATAPQNLRLHCYSFILISFASYTHNVFLIIS